MFNPPPLTCSRLACSQEQQTLLVQPAPSALHTPSQPTCLRPRPPPEKSYMFKHFRPQPPSLTCSCFSCPQEQQSLLIQPAPSASQTRQYGSQCHCSCALQHQHSKMSRIMLPKPVAVNVAKTQTPTLDPGPGLNILDRTPACRR